MRNFNFHRYLVAVLLFASWSVPAWAITADPTWKPRETVTDTLANHSFMIGSDHSLAYDDHGTPGIAFYDDVADVLRYARRVPGFGWAHSVVDMGGPLGSFPSLAYDPLDRPAISYSNNVGNGSLKYARFNGSAWQFEHLDGSGSTGRYTSLAYDNLGRPAIAYQDITNSSLKFIQDTDGDFSFLDETSVTVVNQFDEGYYATLAFDFSNRPMIAHYDETNDDLRFSVNEPGVGWLTRTVDAAGSTGWFPSIAIDPDNGFPAIAYYDDTADDLRYAAWNGDAWASTTVDAAGSVGLHPSLAFDPRDDLPANPEEGRNPAIAYFDSSTTNLKLAWFDGVAMAWENQTVDAVGDVGLTPSLAFNQAGNGDPSIGYFDAGAAGTGHLFFIDDPPAVPGTVDIVGDYNVDGSVDAADYVAARKTSGSSSSLWQTHFGDSVGGSGASSAPGAVVPEPTSLFLGCCAALGLALKNRNRKTTSRSS